MKVTTTDKVVTVVALLVTMGVLAFDVITVFSHVAKVPRVTGHALHNGDPGWIPRVGDYGAPRLPGQCGQFDGETFHRIECPR